MFRFLKHRIVNVLEKIPSIQIFIYNNLQYLKFLFPHDKDYYALNLLFKKNETRSFLDVGGNIGLSTIGFRELGFRKNKILVFEPDSFLYKKYLLNIKKFYNNIHIYNFGLSNRNESKYLFQAYYKKLFLHFNNSFEIDYIKNKIKENYPDKYKNFSYKKKKFKLKKFDNLKIDQNICFIKIDVEGFDHLVLTGMKKLIIQKQPIILIEFNNSNFKKIFKFLKKNYLCYSYILDNNKLLKLKKHEIKRMFKKHPPDVKYVKNSYNVFFIPKKNKISKLNV
ncbi:FkbM family methyltransferase [Pelagibacterales bacterium SAG-MED21]|nr:FkbM family methyltransferase [Pelagibacterales bacterium SAG-MED21]